MGARAGRRGGAGTWRAGESGGPHRALRRRSGAQSQAGGGTSRDVAAACRDDAAALREHDPLNTNALFLLAQLAQGSGELDRARELLDAILALDPREPRARLLAAVVACRQGRIDDALATLYADPHPRLRRELAPTLASLAAMPGLDAAQRSRLATEARFVAAVDALAEGAGSPAANDAIRGYVEAAPPGDPRARVLLARQFLALDRSDEAAGLAPAAGLELEPEIRALLAPSLDALRRLPAWREALR